MDLLKRRRKLAMKKTKIKIKDEDGSTVNIGWEEPFL